MNSLTKLSSILFLFLCFTSWQSAAAAAVKTNGFVDAMKHDLFLVTPKTFDPLISRVRNTDGVAVLLHFKSSDSSMKKFIDDVYNAAAKEAKGMARLGAIDCDEYKSFCEQNLNKDLLSPFVVVYPPNPIPPITLTDHDKKSIVNAALQHVPGRHVKVLNDQNFDTFLGSDLAIPKVILFSQKDAPPVLMKALSNSFKDRMYFGYVPASLSSVVQRYQVNKFPTLMILKAAAKGAGLGKPIIYEGKTMTYTEIHEWLNVHAETFVKGGGFSEHVETDSTPKPWLVQRIPEVSGPSHHDVCFKRVDLCVILLTKGRLTEPQRLMLEELDTEYSSMKADRGVNYKFMWIDVETEINFRDVINFDIANSSSPSLVVINPHKRLRFVSLPSDQEATKSSIKNLLERIASGDGRFTAIKKLLPFAARDADGLPSKSKEEL